MTILMPGMFDTERLRWSANPRTAASDLSQLRGGQVRSRQVRDTHEEVELVDDLVEVLANFEVGDEVIVGPVRDRQR